MPQWLVNLFDNDKNVYYMFFKNRKASVKELQKNYVIQNQVFYSITNVYRIFPNIAA